MNDWAIDGCTAILFQSIGRDDAPQLVNLTVRFVDLAAKRFNLTVRWLWSKIRESNELVDAFCVTIDETTEEIHDNWARA